MTPFRELNWGDLDIWGIVVGRGVVTVEPAHEQACEEWLKAHGYDKVELNFGSGISPVVSWLGAYFHWEARFGYTLDRESRNLSALRDGFEIASPNLVMKLKDFERAWSENSAWSRGLLSIVSEHSIRQLALGKRFFAILPVQHSDSIPIGESIEELIIPSPFRFRGPAA